MYRGLAWGYDPRIILNDLRLQLRAKQPEGYDWASLVAYAALPHNLELQLSHVRFERISRSIEQTLKLLDAYIDEQLETQHQLRHDNAESQERRALAESRRKDALRHLQRLLSQTPTRRRTQRSQIHGLLASTEKRRAGMALVHSAADEWGADEFDADFTEALRSAAYHYGKAYEEDPSQTWALTQQLSLSVLLDGVRALESRTWNAAVALSERDLRAPNRERQLWALANLVELYLLATLAVPKPTVTTSEARESALKYAHELREMGGKIKVLFSANRQIRRYSALREVSRASAGGRTASP